MYTPEFASAIDENRVSCDKMKVEALRAAAALSLMSCRPKRLNKYSVSFIHAHAFAFEYNCRFLFFNCMHHKYAGNIMHIFLVYSVTLSQTLPLVTVAFL